MSSSKILRYLFTTGLLVVFPAVSHAQATRTWVSGVGDDANPCSRTAPCKTFAGAISKTAAGGEISVLDPGGFGAVTITKSITINGTGTLASILASFVNGVVVSAGANDTIILRDISINGAGNGLSGIRYLSGGTLMVDHCSIYGFRGSPGRGIDVALSAAGNLKVVDTVIENVLEDGIRMTTSAGLLSVAIDNTRIMNCGQSAVHAGENVRGAITHSRINRALNGGVLIGAGNSEVNIDESSISFCNFALKSSPGSTLRVSNSIIENNSVGLTPNGGALVSLSGNSVTGNSFPGPFTSTSPKQ
jgi:hypothetical protein